MQSQSLFSVFAGGKGSGVKMAVSDILHTVTAGGQMQITAAAPPPNQVAVSAIGAAGLAITDAIGNQWFEPGDHVLLKNAWASVPFGFCPGEMPGGHYITLSWRDNLGGRFGIPELGVDAAGDGMLPFPEINCPIPFPPDGLFIQTPTAGGIKYRLSIEFSNLELSMVGLPADMIGQVVTPVYYFQVLHTLQLSAVP